MNIKTKAGQIIEFSQNIDNFGWKLLILSKENKKQIIFELTDEEVRWITLDLNKQLGNL